MKRWIITICLGLAVVVSAGCAGKLPPREELKRAVTRSFDAGGFNYSSTSRVTQLSFRQLNTKVPENKNIKNTDALLDIVRGFSIGVDGALDTEAGKSEALYDLRYSKDNVDVSIRLPVLVDYKNQTIYVGPSLLHTILGITSPKDMDVRGKMIRIHIPDLLKDGSEFSGRLSRLLGGKRFTPENMNAMKNVFRNTALRALGRLDAARFSELPLTERDGKAGIDRRIQLRLGRGESMDLVVDLIDEISRTLLQEGAINEKEHELLKAIADRRKLEELLGDFELSLISDVGVSSSGYVAQVVCRIGVADKDGELGVTLENISNFDGYGAPRFSIKPEGAKFIEFGDLMNAIKSIGDKDKPEDKKEDRKQEMKENNKGPSPSAPPLEDAPAEIDAG